MVTRSRLKTAGSGAQDKERMDRAGKKKLWIQLWSATGDNTDYFSVLPDGAKTEEAGDRSETIFTDIPEKEIVDDIGIAVPVGDPQEVLEVTDDEAAAIEEGAKEYGHAVRYLEEIATDPKFEKRLARIRKQLEDAAY